MKKPVTNQRTPRRLTFAAILVAVVAFVSSPGSPKADTIVGYPCDVSLSSGDGLTVTVYTSSYCSGSYLGYWQINAVDSASAVGPGLYRRDAFLKLYEQLVVNYWRIVAVSRDSNNRVFSVGIRAK